MPTLQLNFLGLPLGDTSPESTEATSSGYQRTPSVSSTWSNEDGYLQPPSLSQRRNSTEPLTPPRSEYSGSSDKAGPLSESDSACMLQDRDLFCDCDKEFPDWTCILNEEYDAPLAVMWNILQGDEDVNVSRLFPRHPSGLTVAFLEQFGGASNLTKSHWSCGDKEDFSRSLKFDRVMAGCYRVLTYDVSVGMICLGTLSNIYKLL